MQPSRSRFSHRHLLALCTFLVPLAILAGLGWSELQRSGASAQAALDREARQFLASAQQALEQRLEQHVPPLLAESERLLVEHGPVRTTLALRAEPRFAALRDILMLDEQIGVVWPAQPLVSVSLPLARDSQRVAETPTRGALQAADLLLTHGRLPEATALLQHVVARFDAPGRDRREDPEELLARFRLATAQRAQGDGDAARTQFERAQRLATSLQQRNLRDAPALALMAEAALAELGAPEDRLRLLRDIAENRRENNADGLLSAVAQRLAATFAIGDPRRAEVDELLREERQRAATRTFAGDYELLLQPVLRLRRTRPPGAGETEHAGEQRLVATIGGETVMVCMRTASPAEAERWKCAYVGLHLDLGELLRELWPPFLDRDGTFVLAVHDPDDAPIVPPPPVVPADHSPPAVVSNGLSLSAYPADPARLQAEAAASAQGRTLLILALFVTALGGALWSWRSVSREAELAALKIDLVSRVSHELKTPLALVRMYGETLSLRRARDADQAAEFGGVIAREAERLTTLIQRILDFSRQQAGTLTYQPEPLDLGEALRGIAEVYAPHLEARGAVLLDSLAPGLQVRCDRSALESAVVNLLENAAKYGPDGADEHEVELESRRDGGRAVIEVRDRGRGIPEVERERVFEGFYRASNAGEVRGAGLGLSLVRHFARAHGGDVDAAPRPGGGTVLRLWLPLLADEPADVPAAATASRGPESTKP